MKKILLTTALAAIGTLTANAAVLFSEDFGNIANGTAITTSNTSFTYARISTGADPLLAALNPGSFSGASAQLRATNTSLTGLGVTSGTYTAFDVGTLEFSLRTASSFSGMAAQTNFFIGVGTGANTFTNNSTFSGNDLTAALQINGSGQLQTRDSSNAWVNVGSALSTSTNYEFRFVFNGSGSPVSYEGYTVAAGRADIFINGSLFGDDVSIRDAVSVSAFRFYSVSTPNPASFELDNVKLYNSAIPEPSTYVMLIGGLAAAALVIRRRRS